MMGGQLSYCSLLSLVVLVLVIRGNDAWVPSMNGELHHRSKTTETTHKYDTYYFSQQVDHFSFSNSDTYKQKYLYADQYWDKDGGPVFFYAGNEGTIELFCENSGLMWDWAPEFKALLIFAEHRYYGVSMPYGNDSYKDPAHVGYLTSEQALADFAQLLLHLKATTPGMGNSPIIAFGGSYGGMLASWLRMKYPNVVQGALAASAPIWQFVGLMECGAFNEVVTHTFEKSGPNCAQNIRKSWAVLTSMGETAEGRQFLQQGLRLCKPLNSTEAVSGVKDWLSGKYVNLAMIDYPYPADFLDPLPGWPIKVVCEFLKSDKMSDKELVEGLGNLLNVYYNYTGSAKCFNTSSGATPSLSDIGWGYQSCTEMVMPMCSDGVKDMFEPSPWDYPAYSKGCQEQWGITPRPEWVITQYGGKNITAATNIIFSNGLLDPWSSGGVMTTLSKTLVSIIIEDGAHHLDLRSANPLDTKAVIKARKQEKAIVTGWIKEHYKSLDRNHPQLMQMSVQADDSQFATDTDDEPVVPLYLVIVAAFSIVITLAIIISVARLSMSSPLSPTVQQKYSLPYAVEEKSPLVQNVVTA